MRLRLNTYLSELTVGDCRRLSARLGKGTQELIEVLAGIVECTEKEAMIIYNELIEPYYGNSEQFKKKVMGLDSRSKWRGYTVNSSRCESQNTGACRKGARRKVYRR